MKVNAEKLEPQNDSSYSSLILHPSSFDSTPEAILLRIRFNSPVLSVTIDTAKTEQ
jgi:hypothetical protein